MSRSKLLITAVRIGVVPAVLLMCAVAPASAAVSTWVAAGSTSNFSEALNWDAVPSPDSDLVFPAGSAFASKGSPVNDITGMTLNAINIYEAYNITGNAVTCKIVNNYNATTATLALPLATAGTAALTITVTTAGGLLNLPGLMSGGGPVNYAGPGSKKLNGSVNNTLTGLTTLSEGSLRLWNSQSFSPIVVSSGTLLLVNDATVNNVTLGGGSTSTLSFNETLTTLTPRATCANLIIGSGCGFQIVAKGPATTQYSNVLASGVTLTESALSVDTSGYTPAVGSVMTIIDQSGTTAVVGTFAGLVQGATVISTTNPGSTFTISYVGGTGNDVTLTASSASAGTTSAGTATGTGGTAGTAGTAGTPTSSDDDGGCGLGGSVAALLLTLGAVGYRRRL